MRIIILFCLCCVTFSALSQECNENYVPDMERFTDNENGTISDSSTGLMWQRCHHGQSWDGSTCSGRSSGAVSWPDAFKYAEQNVFSGYVDWRLPNVKELYSLVNTECRPSTFDGFDNISGDYKFASSSPVLMDSRGLSNLDVGLMPGFYIVSFYVGLIYTSAMGGDSVRLVRYD